MTLEDFLRKNVPLKNMFTGRRCFLIGNGPSLKTQDITRLKDEVTIVASSFFRHPDAKVVSPPFWVLADPYFWTKPDTYFMPVFKYALEKGVTTRLFAPSGGLPYFANANLGPLIDFHAYHYDHSVNISTPIDFSRGIPPFGQNVMTVCLMLALYLGCNPIYFIGCDRDYWNMTKEEYKTYSVRHFYEEKNPQHTCGDYMPWEEWLKARETTDYQYDQLKRYAALSGFNIYNATPGGQFDSFPRIDYETLFSAGPASSATEQAQFDILSATRSAIRLMNDGENPSALILLDESIRRNINRPDRVAGLEYLKALCLARQNRFSEALVFARQDYHGNPANRAKSELLIRELHEACGA
jgi:hypothetical protein